MRLKKGKAFSGILIFIMLACTVFSFPASADTVTQKKTVRVSCGVNDSLYLDDYGKPQGYLAYYVEQLAYINNWELEYVKGSWSDSVQNLYDGKIDLLFPTQKTEERIGKMLFSDYIGGYQTIALYAKEDAEIYYDDYANYEGKKVAISEGSSNSELLESYAKQHGFSYVSVNMNTTEDKIEALSNGSVDMIVFSTLNEVPDSKIVSMLDYLPFYFCTRVDDASLMAEVNNGMRSIMADNPNVASYVYDSVLKGSSPISFTREENEVITNTNEVRVGLYDDALPLSGSDENGNPKGIYVDILKAIEEKSGIKIKPVLIPRGELLYSRLDSGTVDFVMGSKNLAYNEDDTSGYMCSESIMDYITVAITRADYKFDDTNAPTFVITKTRKYWESEIYKLYPNAKIEYRDDVKDCLTDIQDNKADVTLMNTWEYNYQSKNARFSGMLEWESLRKQTDLVLGVKKGTDSNLMSVMEKSIDQVAGTDKDNIVASNLNMSYSSHDAADYWYNIKATVIIIASVLAALLIVLVVFMRIRRKHMAELEQKNRELEESNDSKNLFLSRMSHELRTPLNAINGYATVMDQSISEHKLDENSVHSYTESIRRAVKYQLAIIGDLLDIQKIESGKMELVPTEVDSAEYMNSIVTMIAPEAKEKGVDFTYERLSTVKDTYILDGVRFEQVLLNLLHNAVKFTPAGGKVKITAEVTEQNEKENTLKFVISDTGIGMSEEFQEKYLFKRFAQEYKGNTSPYEGCGTGLAMCKEIITLMGGEISCESKPGEGSSFTVVIKAEHTEKKRRRRAKTDYSAYDLSGIKVLLCEDNKMNQDMECRLLNKMNCTVDIADDGKIGTEKFAESAVGTYDVILMDIRMPNMDGLEASRQIRAMERADAKSVAIFAVSANSFEEDIKKSLDAGMNEHLPKPVDVRILYAKISEYCKKQ